MIKSCARNGHAPPPLSSLITTSDIESITKSISSRLNNAIKSILDEKHNDDNDKKKITKNPFVKLSVALGEASESSACVTLPSMTHGDADVRSASTKSKDDLKAMFDGTFARKDLYDMLLLASSSSSSSSSSTKEGESKKEKEDKRLESMMLTSFRRNGCGLDECKRKELMDKRSLIEEKCSAFISAINENTDYLIFSEEELDGVLDISQYPLVENKDDDDDDDNDNKVKNSGNDGKTLYRKVMLKTPQIIPILQFATKSSTRKAIVNANAKKCQDTNTSLFLDVLQLRQECAALLGYSSHAQYMLETKMASTPDEAVQFVQKLLDRSKIQLECDLKLLKNLKVKEEGEGSDNDNDNDNTDGSLQLWDMSYYIRKYKASMGVDEAELRDYFPLDHVKNEILAIYQELLGLRFDKVEHCDVEIWHEDVECFAVHDAKKEEEEGVASSSSSSLLGYFYLDIFPRDGKYSHQCVYPLRPGYVKEDSSSSQHILPACANIGNLSRGTEGNPSMLRFREVETFFHEFGHVMHCVLSKSEHSLQAWAWSAVPWPGGVEQDFLEVPSMMLENFVWQPEILKRLSRRPKDGASLPEAAIDALSKSRFTMDSYTRCRVLSMSLYDLIVHGGSGPTYSYKGQKYDAIELYRAILTDATGVPTIPDTFPVCSWYHPMMGYDAGYYSYYWSEAYAADLFSEFEQSTSVVQLDLGLKYRDTILSPCAMVDGNTMLRNFLGREPSIEAFLKRF